MDSTNYQLILEANDETDGEEMLEVNDVKMKLLPGSSRPLDPKTTENVCRRHGQTRNVLQERIQGRLDGLGGWDFSQWVGCRVFMDRCPNVCTCQVLCLILQRHVMLD